MDQKGPPSDDSLMDRYRKEESERRIRAAKLVPEPTPKVFCSHVWGKYNGPSVPIPAVYSIPPPPPTYSYTCIHYAGHLRSPIRLITVSEKHSCIHDMKRMTTLGPNYEASMCNKCDYQTCEMINK